jgi:predicted RNA-binding Zn ribbon-like protein
VGVSAETRRCETGATWLDLVATVTSAYGPAPVESVTSVALLRDWLAAVDLQPKDDPTEADLERARELREALRGLALAVVRAEPWPAGDVDIVNQALADDRPLVLAKHKVRPPATCREALARIARQAVEHLSVPVALRQCADQVCGMLFIDDSGRRRWCSAEICGVRNRVRAHRQRNTG